MCMQNIQRYSAAKKLINLNNEIIVGRDSYIG